MLNRREGGCIRAYSSMVEQRTHNPLVAGSSPAGPTTNRTGEMPCCRHLPFIVSTFVRMRFRVRGNLGVRVRPGACARFGALAFAFSHSGVRIRFGVHGHLRVHIRLGARVRPGMRVLFRLLRSVRSPWGAHLSRSSRFLLSASEFVITLERASASGFAFERERLGVR